MINTISEINAVEFNPHSTNSILVPNTSLHNSIEEERECKSKSKEQDIQKTAIYPDFVIPFSKEEELNFNLIQELSEIFPEDITSRYISLPLIQKKTIEDVKTLFVDLDETLIHTIDPNTDYLSLNIVHETCENISYVDSIYNITVYIKIVIRPYAIKFLEELSNLYEIIV